MKQGSCKHEKERERDGGHRQIFQAIYVCLLSSRRHTRSTTAPRTTVGASTDASGGTPRGMTSQSSPSWWPKLMQPLLLRTPWRKPPPRQPRQPTQQRPPWASERGQGGQSGSSCGCIGRRWLRWPLVFLVATVAIDRAGETVVSACVILDAHVSFIELVMGMLQRTRWKL